MSTPRPRDRRTPFGTPGTSTPIGDQTLNLQRLPAPSRFPLTPNRFTSATPTGDRSASRWTPRRGGAGAPSTPYGARAMQRRAANTPARERRKSGQMRRETTFDILRNLGKALAPTTQPIRSSPQEKPEPEPEPQKPVDEIEVLDNEPPMERPRLSLPLEEVEEEEEEGGPEIKPPKLSLAFDEEDITVEYPRRANDQERARLSMASFGGPRLSENFGDSTRLESGSEDEGDTTGLQDEGEGGDETLMSQGAFDRGGDTEDLGRINWDFDIPSPPPPGEQEEPLETMYDDEGFELPGVDLPPNDEPMPDLDFGGDNDDDDDDDDAAGGFGSGLNFPQRASPSESPGVVGGGLREEESVAPGTKQKRFSRHGHLVPNMPSGVVKKLATQFARGRGGSKTKISKPTMAAIEQATSWYFEQVGEDLAAYSKHAGRKTIDESDVTALMKRQRHINNTTTVFSLAQKHLPKELLQDMRLAMPP